jgi:hypothetical protein
MLKKVKAALVGDMDDADPLTAQLPHEGEEPLASRRIEIGRVFIEGYKGDA